MAEVVDCVEDLTAPREWDEGPRWPIRDVHYEGCLTQVYLFKVETRASVGRDSLKVLVEGLVGGQRLQVDAPFANGVDDAS